MREQLILLGGKIKELRKTRKTTLQSLAEQTGLTAGLLSKIENFRTVPSLPVLMNIAAALQVDLSELFAGMSFRHKPEWLLIRSGDHKTVEREDESRGMSYAVILETALNAVNLQVLLVTIQPQVRREPVSGEGDEMLYILSGRVEYRVGDDTITLNTGDTLFFDGALPHAPVNTGKAPVTLLACYFLREDN
jgi:transcriptional regulator with XRE-family HTH domain